MIFNVGCFVSQIVASAMHADVKSQQTSAMLIVVQVHVEPIFRQRIVSHLQLIRNIKFKQGNDGWLFKNKAPIYIFDGGFMLIIVVTEAAVHPGRFARKAFKTEKGDSIELNEAVAVSPLKIVLIMIQIPTRICCTRHLAQIIPLGILTSTVTTSRLS